MSINESSATAIVSVRGLGIGCFNPEKKRRETALIHDGKHQLSIKILKPTDGIDGEGPDYVNVNTYRNLKTEDVEISIKGVGNPKIEGYEVYTAEKFDRLNPNESDENDFRWLVDVTNDEMHADKLVKSSDLHRFPMTRLVIENGLFYTHNLNKDLVFEKVEKDADGNEVGRSAFGNVAETVGAKIESDFVSFKIKVGDEEHAHLFPRNQGPYKIEISNMDYNEDAEISDMPTYYSYFADSEGTVFDLEPLESANVQSRAANQKQYCHPLEGGDGFWATIFKFFFDMD